MYACIIHNLFTLVCLCVRACVHQLREYTKELRALVSKDGDDSSVVSTLTQQMKEIYRIVSICLGIPPETFTWEYYDKSKTYHKIGPITPIDFYNEYVKPVYNVEDKVWNCSCCELLSVS